MNIKIGKGGHSCTQCERDFQHEEELFSLIRLQDQVFNREDYCKSCWNPERADDAYSTWAPRYYDPKVAEQEPPEVFSPLRQCFYETVESTERPDLSVAYLAAQLLRRQKVFRLIKETDELDGEVKITLFNDRIGNRLIEVRDPDLSHSELQAGRGVLMERLNALENPDADAPEEEEESCGETRTHDEPEEQPVEN